MSKRKSEPTQAATTLPDEAYDSLPCATLTLTRESIWLTRHDERGLPLCTYPVKASDVAGVFNNFQADTGLLPPDVLFWQVHQTTTRIGVYVPPARRTIKIMQGRRERKFTIPVPGLVFVGEGARYFVYAALDRPTRVADQLYHAPFWNVYPDGLICMGNTNPPVCSVTTIGQFLQLWWESDFTMHLGGDVVKDKRPLIKFYESITNARKFPSKQLIPSVSMAHVLGKGHAHQALMAGEDEPQDEDVDGEPEPVIDEFYGPLDGTNPNGD